jgi:two-component system chemotaxis sensor kinase CheA
VVPKSDEFQKKLLATFKEEAAEHLAALSSGLIALERSPSPEKQSGLIETIFREAHSLKGASRAVNLAEIETVCQSLESVFSSLKRKEIKLSPELFDLLHKTADALGGLLSSVGAQRPAAEKSLVSQIAQELEAATKGVLPEPKGEGLKGTERSSAAAVPETLPVSGERALPAETVRVRATRLDSLLLQAEELLSTKLTMKQRSSELQNLKVTAGLWEKEWTKAHPALRDVQKFLDRNGGHNGNGQQSPQIKSLLEFVDWNRSFVKSLTAALETLAKAAEQDHRSLGGMVDNLVEDVKRACMLPFSSLLEIFPKFIRDLSRDQGKEVDWVSHGEEVQVDRRILQEMKDPLLHLIRNCIDHGIEKPAERTRKNKPSRGTVSVAISQRGGNKVEILVSDDGSGIDVAKVREAALKSGSITSEQEKALDEQQVLSFLFHSGVSTSPIITDISGRGLGLAIVQEKVEKLGGTVSVESHPDRATTFQIVLPLTLATFRGVLVRLDEHRFVIPTAHVESVVGVSKEGIKTVENRETIEINGQALSLVRLGNVLELPRRAMGKEEAAKVPALVLSSTGKRIAFLVDEISSEQEVLVKSLGPQLSRVRNVAGATVLGTGKVVPILNVPDLMYSAVRATSAPLTIAAVEEKMATARKAILVAEDSITARTLLKNILESAGYHVTTAVDGVDAVTTLRSEEFDLVVSDVDMPRMNGFGLTAKIRADKKLSELPVVLVTALESRQDREHGIDVGANAYIVKSSFDQSNLLEVIRRLI